MKLLARGWHRALERLAAKARAEVVVCSPYVGREGTELLTTHLTQRFRQYGAITFVTDLSPVNICQRSTDPWALRRLWDNAVHTVVRHLPGVHAKVYVADKDVAIVGSGNLTAGGLYRNFEYALELQSDRVAGQIKRDILDYGGLGADVAAEQLDAYCEAVRELQSLFDEQRRSARREIRRRFQQSLRNAQDSLIRLRLSGGPIHTVFGAPSSTSYAHTGL